MERQRIRVGRGVLYAPTAAEEAANGDGPWAAQIVATHPDGSADLRVFPPTAGALTDPLVTQADATAPGGAYAQAEAASAADLANANKAAINALAASVVGVVKAGVVVGSLPGTFSLSVGA